MLPVFAIAVLALAIYGATQTNAQSTQNKYPSIVQKLIEKFGLKEADVQAVFDAERTERQQQMQKAKEERLSQAVKDGTITEAQKQAILKKWQEMQTQKQQHRQEMQKWMEEQEIDPTKLSPYIGFGHKGMRGWAK